MLLRVLDTVIATNNQCTFMVSKDSCTTMFKLSLKNDFTVGQTEISDISYYDPNAPCPNKLVGIETDLISTGQYFTQTIQPFFKLNNAPFLFYGKVDGKYSIEYFDHDSLSEFKPWIFYEIICAYFYQLCEK